jgi:hypothetical protein
MTSRGDRGFIDINFDPKILGGKPVCVLLTDDAPERFYSLGARNPLDGIGMAVDLGWSCATLTRAWRTCLHRSRHRPSRREAGLYYASRVVA